jgi:adenylyltransferase/sulfurtransferase
MPTPLKYRKPRLPSHFYVLCEPPDAKGDEVLRFISERRRIKLKGHFFREFRDYVIPLLDGRHTVEDIQHDLSDIFRPQDLEAGLALLEENNLLQDGDGAEQDAVAPQRSFLHEVCPDPAAAQEKLVNATVTILGAGGLGATAALALAAAGPGAIRCVDSLQITPQDTYLSPAFSRADIGGARAEILRRRLVADTPAINVTAHTSRLASDEDIRDVVSGSDLVLSTLDGAQSWLTYKVNRVCLAQQIRSIVGSVSGMEVVIGPVIRPGETPCYMCYKMRAVACAEDSEGEFAFERMLDQRRQDDSARRENLSFATGIAGNLLGLEAFKLITGAIPVPDVSRVMVFDLIDMTMKKHVVLRKPWCPACFPEGQE